MSFKTYHSVKKRHASFDSWEKCLKLKINVLDCFQDYNNHEGRGTLFTKNS